MKLFNHLKWQFLILYKNSIITISIIVTLIYGVLLFFLKDSLYANKIIISFLLNDPTVIGYFFIALSIFTERKTGVIKAIFVSPISLHHYLIPKVISISIIGLLCAIAMVISIMGFGLNFVNLVIGLAGICLISALLGLIMIPYANDFFDFALKSIPIFLLFTGVTLANYLGIFDIGQLKYLLPIQGSLDLIDYAITNKSINVYYAYSSIVLIIPVLYIIAYKVFKKFGEHE